MVIEWDPETKVRVLIEKKYDDLTGCGLITQLKYFVSHNDWKKVLETLKKIHFEGMMLISFSHATAALGEVDSSGRYLIKPEREDLKEILEAMPEVIQLGTVHSRLNAVNRIVFCQRNDSL